ncbi:MAG TPA: hypothetical protein VGE43_07645, partial [Acidimicrobiales bacterium]
MKTFPRALLLAATSIALASSVLPSGTASAPPAPRTTVLDVRGLDQGEPPAIPWVERRRGGTVIHSADGSVETPVSDDVAKFAPMGSGYVVQTMGTGRPLTVRWIGADGTAGAREWSTGFGLAVSARGRAVAFAGRRGRVWAIDQEGERHLRFYRVPIDRLTRAAALTGENCKEGEGRTGTGCSIAVNGPNRSFYTTSHGIVDQVPR